MAAVEGTPPTRGRRPGGGPVPIAWIALAVFALATALYANTARNGFSHDDLPLIENNPLLDDLGNVPRFFAMDYFAPSGRSGLYRPLVNTSYAVDRALYGEDAGGFHVTNTLLHAGVSVLVLLLVWSLTRDRGIAAATGLLFAAHAVHTEAVASLTLGRPDLLAALFGLGTLWLHVRARGAPPGPRGAYRAGSFACYLAGLFCKESAFTVFGLVVAVDWIYRADAARPTLAALGRTLREGLRPTYLPLLLLTGAYLALRLLAHGGLGVSEAFHFIDNPLAYVDPLTRVVNALWILYLYLGLFLFPLHLSHDYSYDHIPLIEGPGDPRVALLVLLLAATAALVVWSWRRHRHVFFGLVFFAIAFSVGSNVLAPITTMMGERVIYFPSLGLCLVLAVALRGAARALARPPGARRALFAALLAVVVGLNGARTIVRNGDWIDMHTIRIRDAEAYPRNAKIQTNAGYSLRILGEPTRALRHFDAAIAIVGSPELWVEPYRGKVLALMDLGRDAEARAVFHEMRPFSRDPRDERIRAALAARLRERERGRSP